MIDPVQKSDRVRASIVSRTATAWSHAAPYVWTALRFVRFVLTRALEIVLAIVLLFEEWGWRPLAALLARLRQIRLWARFEDWVGTLPPYPSLAVFALPSVLILPLKLAALWLVAHGHVFAAGLLFVGAKIVGTAIVARLFLLLQPKLMQIWWFARAYTWFMPWKEALFARIRASWAWRVGRIAKERAKRLAAGLWRRWRPGIVQWWAHLRPRIANSLSDVRRRISRIFGR